MTPPAGELYEETGAREYRLYPISAYAAGDEAGESFGMLYFAEISAFGPLPEMEIAEVVLGKAVPGEWTYADIQPFLLKRMEEWLAVRG